MTPDNIAIVLGSESITYLELNKQANQFARYLINSGDAKQNIIGVLHDYSLRVYVGILAVLKMGKAYLPIDTSLPDSRIQFMLKDSYVKTIITSNHENRNGYNFADQIILINTDIINEFEPVNLNLTISRISPVYVIYTSGSTGVPKGIVVDNTALVNLCFSHNSYYEVSYHDRISKYAGFGFDASVWEFFPGLIKGSSLYIIEESIKYDVQKVNEYFIARNITISFLPTQFCERFMDCRNTSLRILLTGGDKLKYYRKNEYKLYNNYGPTENSVVSTRFLVDNIEYNIPIGKPLDNTQINILDKLNNLQPIGVPGELCISGEGLALGYLNNPELTTEKFIPHPFKEGERLYRTGDLARWLPDGNIEFLGRIDHQVKIRGFRIELGETESTLLKYEDIKESVVGAIEENNDKSLCAYVVSKDEVNQEELRNYLSTSLPDYMVPSYFVELDKLPLTSNGKVNRKALPSPEVKAGDDYVAASNEIEKKLVEIWSEVLNIDKEEISINANFFSIGGHSLKATACINKLINEFNINIPLIEIFKNPTIIQLAYFVEVNKLKTGIADDHLILLKEGAVNGVNIFLIHDGSGEVDGYIEFCKQANDGINYWGIRAGNLKNHEPVNFTIEQLTNRYIKCIKKVQQHGEYNIAGWSLGGIIAFEMARQLEQENDKIRFFGIIDSYAPFTTKSGSLKEFTVESELSWIRNYFDDNEVISRFSSQRGLKDFWFDVIYYLKNIEGASEIIKGEIVRNIGFDIKEYKKVSIEELVKYMNFTRSLNRACNNYVPGNIINTQINYFAASESKNSIIQNWQDFSKKAMEVTEVEGNHFSIFEVPNVKSFYKQFNECFVQVDKKMLFEAN